MALHEVQDGRGFAPLTAAAASGSYDAATELLKAHASIDPRDYSGSTPLYLAVSGEYISLMTLLLNNNADMHALNARGLSPYRLALTKNPRLLQSSMLQL